MKVWCGHQDTISDGDDTVCARCGVVLDAESPAPGTTLSQSRASLYELREVGSRDAAPAMTFAMSRTSGDIRRYFRGGLARNRDLSDFSNLCEKLLLPMPAQEHAWTLFSRATESGSSRGAAERACWAIHNTCRSHGIPISGDEIISAAMAAYGRRRLPDMFTMAYRHMEVAGASREGSDSYYFNLNLRRMVAGLSLTEAEFSSRKSQAWRLYRETFVQGSADCRARRAISAAFGVG